MGKIIKNSLWVTMVLLTVSALAVPEFIGIVMSVNAFILKYLMGVHWAWRLLFACNAYAILIYAVSYVGVKTNFFKYYILTVGMCVLIVFGMPLIVYAVFYYLINGESPYMDNSYADGLYKFEDFLRTQKTSWA